ncbi:MAG: hypothetical protein ACI35P_02625 [Bacillus sp. (in: firmicutes)]
MTIPPLLAAVVCGIIYGIGRSISLANRKNDDSKKMPNPYLESIVVSLAVYLLLSLIQ